MTSTLDEAIRVWGGDLDGDLDMDIVAGAYGGSSLRWYENDGAQSFTEHVITAVTDLLHASAAGARVVSATLDARRGVISTRVEYNKSFLDARRGFISSEPSIL